MKNVFLHFCDAEKENLIHIKHSEGYEKWFEYDKNNLTYYKHSEGYEKRYKYNENNNLITDGGRVLGISAIGDTLEEALTKA